ncbi:MAG: hypothetical protein AAFY36_01045 [Bacteroidota bacterium]
MNSIKDVPESAFTIADLLNQIDSANKMIEVHQEDEFMVAQYQDKRAEFVSKLQNFLARYKLTVVAA